MSKAMRRWDSYQTPPSFVLGFHGCDSSVGAAILRGKTIHLKPSENDYDWLGTGIYFWENSPRRAFDFAEERSLGKPNSRGKVKEPFVLGAVINLGRCLDLRDASSLLEVRAAYDTFSFVRRSANQAMPRNVGPDLRLRKLDCAVLNYLHVLREVQGLDAYDTIRADFWEGEELYPGAGFRQQDHIQICVRDTASVLGYFRPLAEA